MRRLTRYKLSSLLFCGLAAVSSPLAAQTKGTARVRSEQVPPAAAPKQEQRPDAQPLKVKAVPPALDAVLKDWHDKTSQIRELQGEHRRWKYEPTFAVAMVSAGKFYYRGPDKGRIDIVPQNPAALVDVDPKTEGVQIRDDTDNVYTVKPDQPESWICDGTRILKIDDVAKTYEELPIPPQHQGANIMDGPLPFLFGLPPEKAKQRYDMSLEKHKDPNVVYVVVRPRLQKDAANWSRADVMLRKDTYLPLAVQLLDPGQTGKTVFSFGEPKVNPNGFIALFKGDPFKPSLFGLKPVQTGPPTAAQPLNFEGKPLEGMPAVIGLNHKEAAKVLVQRGFRGDVEIRKGPVTKNEKLLYHVADQSPAPNAKADPEAKIVLVLYVAEKDLKKEVTKPQ